MKNINGVTLTQIMDFITEKTGIEYALHIGEESGFNNDSKYKKSCYIFIPASLGKLKCSAGYDEENDMFYFKAINAKGEDIYDDKQFAFLWSFDLDVCDETGVKYLHREAIENGVLCLNMLNYDYRQDLLSLIK